MRSYLSDMPEPDLIKLLAGRVVVAVPMVDACPEIAGLVASGHKVVGLEVVPQAAHLFFRAAQLVPMVDSRARIFRAPQITIYALSTSLTRAAVGPIDAIFDRRGMIAVPEDARRGYVDRLRALAAPGCLAIVSSSGREAEAEAEVRMLYDGCAVELVAEDRASCTFAITL
jgi:hypothetical protein